MKLRRIVLVAVLMSISVLSYGQNETLKSSSIDVVPHWKENEVYPVLIKSTTTDVLKQTSKVYFTTFNANFKVLEKNETGYLVEWVYTNSKIANNEPNCENNILGKLLNVKIKIKLSEVGKFIELVNVDEIRMASNKAIDELLAKETNPNMKVLYNGTKQLFASKQGLEIGLLKQIKLYNFSFGYSYKTNYEQVNNIKFPNSLGGEPFDAVEKVKLVNVDFENSVCKIQTSKVVDGKVLSKSIIDFLKRNDKEHAKEIDKELGNSVFEMTENSEQELNFKKGILIKTSFSRKAYLGFQNRTVLLEIEAI